MTPEDNQVHILFTYSSLYLGLGVLLWRKKWTRLEALNKNKPCALYLRMRFETSKLFYSKSDHLAALSTFASNETYK